MSPLTTREPEIAPIVWHDLECGSYAADLQLWRELAARTALRGKPARILDLGCGTGRVTLDLARLGHRLIGLDLELRFVAECRRRARARNVAVGASIGDVRTFDLGRRFDLVLAAMQLLQLLSTADERVAALRRIRSHLREGGLFAAALLDLGGELTDDQYVPPLPDMRESDGWVWSSQPVALRIVEDGAALTLERLRRAVSPSGAVAVTESSVTLELVPVAELEEEFRAAGIAAVERREIPATDEHVGSVAVIGEARRG
jgi:SAM-dependent methyltransferase